MSERSFIAVMLASVVFVGSLLVIEVASAGMRRPTRLEMSQVVGWPHVEGCTDAANWVAEWDYGAGWMPAKPGGRDLAAGQCIGYLRGVTVKWRACCVCKEPGNCKDDAGQPADRLCVEAETVEKFPEPCTTIMDLGGADFTAEEIAKWNQDHVQAATPVPTPNPTPQPTPPPQATMLPYMGACCFDPEKWWVCGISTEPTCTAQGGFKWTKQTACSEQACTP